MIPRRNFNDLNNNVANTNGVVVERSIEHTNREGNGGESVPGVNESYFKIYEEKNQEGAGPEEQVQQQ